MEPAAKRDQKKKKKILFSSTKRFVCLRKWLGWRQSGTLLHNKNFRHTRIQIKTFHENFSKDNAPHQIHESDNSTTTTATTTKNGGHLHTGSTRSWGCSKEQLQTIQKQNLSFSFFCSVLKKASHQTPDGALTLESTSVCLVYTSSEKIHLICGTVP